MPRKKNTKAIDPAGDVSPLDTDDGAAVRLAEESPGATPAVIYARFSPRPAGKAETTETIENQIAACRAYAATRGWQVLRTCSDREASGASREDRPGLFEALATVIKHNGVLIVTTLSRLARSTIDVLEIVREIEAGGASIAVLDITVDTTTPAGKLFLTIIAAFVQMERELRAVATRDSMRAMQSRGRRVGSIPPYGYEADPDDATRWRPNPREQEALSLIHRLYTVDRLSLAEIAERLEADGHKSRGQGGWRKDVIRKILLRHGVQLRERGHRKSKKTRRGQWTPSTKAP